MAHDTKKYHQERARQLKEWNDAHPDGPRAKNLRDIGLSLTGFGDGSSLGSAQPPVEVAATVHPKRARKARAKPLKEYNDAPTEMMPTEEQAEETAVEA